MRELGHKLKILPLRRAASGRQHPETQALSSAMVWPDWGPGAWIGAGSRWLRHRAERSAWAELAWGGRRDFNLLAATLAYWPQVSRLADSCRAAGIRHLHAHFATHPAMAAMAIHRLTGIPFSFTVHAHDLFEHPTLLRQKIEAAAFVAAISRYNRDELLRLAPGAEEKLRIIHCGVPTGDYEELARARSAATPVSERPLRLLCVAALRPYKGHSILLEACARLRGRMEFELRLAGDGPERRRLESRIGGLGLAAQVRLLGWLTLPQVREQLAWADVFVLPSLREPGGRMDGIPVALMEAMASGLPALSSRISGIPELINSGANGWLIEPGDAAGLSEAIERARDAELRRRWGEAGRQTVAEDFDLLTCARQLSRAIASAAPAALSTPTPIPT